MIQVCVNTISSIMKLLLNLEKNRVINTSSGDDSQRYGGKFRLVMMVLKVMLVMMVSLGGW